VEFGSSYQENSGGLRNQANTYIRFVIGSSEVYRTLPNGVGFGTATEKTDVADTGNAVFAGANGLLWASRDNAVTAILKRTGNDGQVIQFGKNSSIVGNVSVTAAGTSFNTTSDERWKKNKRPLSPGIVDAIDVWEFDWVNGTGVGYGVMAQKLYPVFPSAVTKGENKEDPWSVDYSRLVPLLISTVKDLRARVAELEGR